MPTAPSAYLHPSDPEYQRIQRSAAEAFGDEPATPSAPTPGATPGARSRALFAADLDRSSTDPHSPGAKLQALFAADLHERTNQ